MVFRLVQLFNLFLLLIHRRIISYPAVMNLLLQVITDSHKERFKIGDRRLIVVNPVHAGKKPHGRRRQCRQLRQQFFDLCALSERHHEIAHHARNTHGLNQKSRRCVEQIVLLHGIHISCSAFGIFIDKIIFLIGNLDFLNAHHRLLNPFIQAAVIILIILSGFDHNGL